MYDYLRERYEDTINIPLVVEHIITPPGIFSSTQDVGVEVAVTQEMVFHAIEMKMKMRARKYPPAMRTC